jgi:SAM-dependent methyltransferase
MSDSQTISAAVARLYDAYPFPAETLLSEPPPGYNWRWNWPAAYNFCTGQKPSMLHPRILDAGCGTGVGTEYLLHLNPDATIVGIDLSAGALAVAQERCQKSGVAVDSKTGLARAEFHHLSLFDASQLEGEFNLINCVGVLHHTPDPIRGIQALAKKLAPGGLLHVFVYGDYTDGISVGRQLFAALPEDNRLRKREQERWSWENQRDEYFADMYVHPHEIDYNIHTVFELIDASGLDFIGLSNPRSWDLARLQQLIGKDPALMERATALSERDRYRLIELLDPQMISHYEFFLGRNPLPKTDWSSDTSLLSAMPELSPCMDGWKDSPNFFNYEYEIVSLNESEWRFLLACEGQEIQPKTVGEILQTVDANLEGVRSLQKQQLIFLTPSS